MGPNPKDTIPNKNIPSLCFIKNIVKNPNIIVGEYTYYNDPEGAENFEKYVTHHYDFIGDKLIIGRFCAIAKGVEFIMNGANHRIDSISTYPFYIMGNGWEKFVPANEELTYKGDTIVGNDVWIGQNVTILPGVKIGDGAIIGANSVVSRDIPPYSIAVGNPCEVKGMRFSDEVIQQLLKIQCWNWDIEKINKNLHIISSANLNQIKEL